MINNLKEKLLQAKEALGGKQFVALLVVLLVLFAIPLSVYLVKQRQEIRSRASELPNIRMVLTPSTGTVNPGDTIVVDIGVNALNNGLIPLIGVDIQMSYSDNLQLLSFTKDTEGWSGTQILDDGNPLSRTLRYVAVNINEGRNLANKSYIKLGTLSFKALAAGSATVSYSNFQISMLGLPTTIDINRNQPIDRDTATFTIQGTPASPTSAPDAPPAPEITMKSCIPTPNVGDEVTLSWTNPATAVSWADVSAAGDFQFRSYYHKEVSDLPNIAKTVNVPAGFIGASQSTTPTSGALTIAPNTDYYARLYYNLSGNHVFSAPKKFTTPAACAAAPTVPPTPAPIPGDANLNGCVDDVDYQIWSDESKKIKNTKRADFVPKDGVVDQKDYAILYAHKGEGCSQ